MANQQPAKQIREFGNFLWFCSLCSSAFVVTDRLQPCTLDTTGFSALGLILLFFGRFLPFVFLFLPGQGLHQTTLRQILGFHFQWFRKEQDKPKDRSREVHIRKKVLLGTPLTFLSQGLLPL